MCIISSANFWSYSSFYLYFHSFIDSTLVVLLLVGAMKTGIVFVHDCSVLSLPACSTCHYLKSSNTLTSSFVSCRKGIKSFIQGFLPGIALKIFLIFLPSILMLMSKFEGFICISALERRSATRYYIFQFINVFLGSIITGTAFQQLNNFIHQSANEYVLLIYVLWITFGKH